MLDVWHHIIKKASELYVCIVCSVAVGCLLWFTCSLVSHATVWLMKNLSHGVLVREAFAAGKRPD